ncbi:(2Fe-2S)-binding protein [Aliidongia dinghuensis]|uniref:(2Fe-2S)-binding protein n=2 Tax=Aliidongia dinghuensis TaxID=1867774 RepID=A0A8J2YRC7_9PROT|nr:(2Fe-2S)-binding protein [Aliidongia dinghuensis]
MSPWDAIIIGAGPAGLAAATLLAERQARVLLVDEQPAPGGQIYRRIEHVASRRPDLLTVLGADYAHGADLAKRFRASGADYLPESTVWQVTPEREVWLSRAGRSARHEAQTIVIATGAMERPVPVPGWTLPGVMTAGAVQILLKSAALKADEPLVLAGSGPLLYLLAEQCLAAGARLAAVLDTTTAENEGAALVHLPAAVLKGGLAYLRKGLKLRAAIRKSGVPWFRHVTKLRIEGTDAVAGVTFESRGRTERLDARLVALHEGVIPAQQMTRSIGLAHEWDAVSHCFRPTVDAWGNSSVDGILVAGDGAGIGGARAAEHAGRLAAAEMLRRLGRIDGAARDRLAQADRRALAAHLAIRPFLDRLYAPRAEILEPADAVTICRCEEITAGAVRAVVAQGCLGPNQAKSFLRCGMGPCQGRLCGPTVTSVIAGALGQSDEEVGYYRIRPPLKPITLGELANMDAAE